MEMFKRITWQLVLPILGVCLILLFTTLLTIERKLLIPEERAAWYPGVGSQVPSIVVIDDWFPNYGGGEGVDTVIAKKDTSLRVSTGGDGGWYGARAVLSVQDFSAATIALSYRVHSWGEIDRLMVLFSSDAEFSNYYGINLKNYFSNPQNEEWQDVILETSAFSVIEGNPNWESVTNVAIRVVPVPGVATRVWFDDLQVIPQQRSGAVISMTFDDGFSSVVEASAAMTEKRMAGTAFVIPEYIGEENYLTQAEIDYLADQGWDISGHGKDNLTEGIPADVDTHLAEVYEYLESKKYKGRHHYAYPNGAYSNSVQSQVLEYFQSARTIDGFMQAPEYMYPKNINAVTVSSSTSMEELVGYIDTAVETNSWLILVWHDLTTMPESDVQYHMEDFVQVVNYIDNQAVRVLPYSEAYQMFIDRPPVTEE